MLPSFNAPLPTESDIGCIQVELYRCLSIACKKHAQHTAANLPSSSSANIQQVRYNLHKCTNVQSYNRIIKKPALTMWQRNVQHSTNNSYQLISHQLTYDNDNDVWQRQTTLTSRMISVHKHCTNLWWNAHSGVTKVAVTWCSNCVALFTSKKFF